MPENLTSGRIVVIGDIHGCATALRTLVKVIDPRPEDTIVTLGDYIDWGPDSRGVIEQLIGLSGRCHLVPVLGNHEEMCSPRWSPDRSFDPGSSSVARRP